MVCMVMGLKISKTQLTQREIKLLLIVASSQYFVDSLYSIGSYAPFFAKSTSILLNIFSGVMIAIIIKESKTSLAMVNLRLAIIRQSQI